MKLQFVSLDVSKILKSNIESSVDIKNKFLSDPNCIEAFSQATELIIEHYIKGGRLLIAGNGGSAADAQHLAAEFISRLSKDRAPIAAEALTVDSSILTAISNDYGFEFVFSRQLAAKALKNDIFLGITTSGASLNIIRALEQCKSLKIKSVVFTGNDGGSAAKLADHSVIVPSSVTSLIQELHILLCHTLCEAVESQISKIAFKRN
jgi:D-sedoheptulose 7-phosphate isomerase